MLAGICAAVTAAAAFAVWLNRRRHTKRQAVQMLDQEAQQMRARMRNLTAERNQAAAVIESMAEGVVAVDAAATVLVLNPAAAALFGADRDHAAGRPLLDVIRHHQLQELVQAALATRRFATTELTVFHPTERVLRARAVPCEVTDPQGPSVVLVIQDLTEVHAYERLRKEFVANVSHELKTPLTSIRSLAETLLDGALQDATHNRKFVALIDDEAARLARLIDDLLTLSQIESQAGASDGWQVIVLRPLVDSLLPAFKTELAKQGLSLSVAIADDITVRAHADRLRQVFINLIDNAIKYNRPQGRIDVTAHVQGPIVRITVQDTGIGIPAADLPRIFERFYRVDKARSRELGGTGLGLSIVKHIVEAHRGTVSVASEPGKGSTFSFTLPRPA
jgi:two-component system phosphate regulon sensor histidine kinase PhoR